LLLFVFINLAISSFSIILFQMPTVSKANKNKKLMSYFLILKYSSVIMKESGF
jgi:hypothetical protein